MTVLEIGLALAFAALIVLAAFYRASSRRSRLRFQILEDIASVADGGRSLEQTLDAIAAILVPALGDYCMIDVIEEGQVRRAAVRVDGPGAEAVEKGLAERKPALQEQIADAASVARQEPRFFEHVTEADLRPVAETEEDLAFLLSMKVRSFVTVELRARGRPTGVLSVGVSHSGRRFRQDDADFFAHPRRPRGAGARQRRPLLQPRAQRARTGRDRRDSAARAAAVAAAAHPGLVGGRDVPAGRGRERDRRRLLRRLPHRRRLDGRDRRRHRPRRSGRLPSPPSPATRCAPPRR